MNVKHTPLEAVHELSTAIAGAADPAQIYDLILDEVVRSLGVETQLIVYPGQFHGISRPSFVRDRYERYLAWYDRYLRPMAS